MPENAPVVWLIAKPDVVSWSPFVPFDLVIYKRAPEIPFGSVAVTGVMLVELSVRAIGVFLKTAILLTTVVVGPVSATLSV